jgi:predicted PolB exonuclease-like 3'-5' exonuclease
MFITLDIETAANPEMKEHLPAVEASKTLKDPAKIEADIEKKKEAQVEKMALDPMFGRIVSFAAKSGEKKFIVVSHGMNDECETKVVQSLFKVLGKDGIRLVTFNGNGFDMPYIYKRAIILGITPADFGAPPLSYWTRRYNNDKHYDLMSIWADGDKNRFTSLDSLAKILLGEEKIEIDYNTFGTLVETDEGREVLGNYNMQDVYLTERLFERMHGTLFA